ncbi:metallo-beta-lactamase protein [Irpex rosettiformis]|uniref:Metallo-beta-lactamase protein n=1 Tax=Irpex rosettiformis TaxID=378272 RepID=A0ACB8UGB9_9APHY|nr:metallo-beta-lactamase protein [Irpex rosettiformis]
MVALKQVNKLAIQFIVDNTTEWFLKMPPGFTHEMKYHLTELKPVIDPLTGTPFIDAENYCCAHGFSALIHTQTEDSSDTHLTLFDTGPDSQTITRNLAALQIPTEKIDRVILSHWHADHSGGILAFLRARNKAVSLASQTTQPAPCVFDLHPDRPIARGIAPGGKVIARLPDDPTFEQIQELGGVVEKSSEGHVVADGTVYVSGEIPRVTGFEQGLLGAVRWKGEWVSEEDIMDERYAAIDVVGKGLIIFSACSHAGIVNVVKDAIKTLNRPIYMIIGGLHLSTPDLQERIAPTVDFLANKLRPAPNYVLPMHCSGFNAKVELERALGDGCVPAGTGAKVDVTGDPTAEKQMFAPVITDWLS